MSIKVLTPAFFARSTSAILASRSFHIYNWNQLSPFGAAATTSSIVVVPRVESVYGIPNFSPARATARSPSVCIMRVKPVGAKPNGISNFLPKVSRVISTFETSRRIFGINSIFVYAARARSKLNSDSADPSV
ncbi:unannotated protein [freshwater metagenome]|uniref:Unannotated protein n=1 Tax=freshwater metagenome TaxID=449393 RepID=A0A6J7VWU5_9ZZZZ